MFSEIVMGTAVITIIQNNDNETKMVIYDMETNKEMTLSLTDLDLGYFTGSIKTIVENKKEEQ